MISILLALLAVHQETHRNYWFLSIYSERLSYAGGPQIHGRVPKIIMKMGTWGPQNFDTGVIPDCDPLPVMHLLMIMQDSSQWQMDPLRQL